MLNTAVRLHLFENLLLESCYKKNRIVGSLDKKREKASTVYRHVKYNIHIAIMKGISVVSD